MKFLLSCLLAAAFTLSAANAPKPVRTVTKPFPADFQGFTPKATLNLADGAIVRADTGSLRGFEAELQRLISPDLT